MQHVFVTHAVYFQRSPPRAQHRPRLQLARRRPAAAAGADGAPRPPPRGGRRPWHHERRGALRPGGTPPRERDDARRGSRPPPPPPLRLCPTGLPRRGGPLRSWPRRLGPGALGGGHSRGPLARPTVLLQADREANAATSDCRRRAGCSRPGNPAGMEGGGGLCSLNEPRQRAPIDQSGERGSGQRHCQPVAALRIYARSSGCGSSSGAYLDRSSSPI